MRTVLKRCDTRMVMRPSSPCPRARRGGVALEQRVLGLGVERRGRLVEHQQQRLVAHEAAGQRELLPLAEGDLDAVGPGRAELGVEAGRRAARPRRRRRPGRPRRRRPRSSSSRGTSPTPTEWRARSSKRKKSWNAPASRARHSSARHARPAARRRRGCGPPSARRACTSSLTSVVLPAPFSPTIATTEPAGRSRSTSSSTRRSVPG